MALTFLSKAIDGGAWEILPEEGGVPDCVVWDYTARAAVPLDALTFAPGSQFAIGMNLTAGIGYGNGTILLDSLNGIGIGYEFNI